jgi:hypothetical protein
MRSRDARTMSSGLARVHYRGLAPGHPLRARHGLLGCHSVHVPQPPPRYSASLNNLRTIIALCTATWVGKAAPACQTHS